MRLKPLIISFLTLGSLLSISQANECLNLHEDKARLACYDKQSGYKKKATEVTNNGKWVMIEKISPVDDSRIVFLTVDTRDRIKTGIMSASPQLIIRCQQNVTSLYIDWGTFITMRETRILTRINKEKAQTHTWLMSTDNEASFAPQAISMIKNLLDKEVLTVQVTPFSDSTYTVKFDISGLENAITPVRETCGW